MKKIVVLFTFSLLVLSCKKDHQISEPVDDAIGNETIEKPLVDSLMIQREQDSIQLVRQDSIEKARKDSIALVKKIELENKRKSKKFAVYQGEVFSYWPIKESDSLRKLFYNTFSKDQQYTIAALNRIDTDHINRRDTLIVPNEFKKSFIDYSPFPRTLEKVVDVPKLVVFSYPIQAYAVYEKGRLVKWGPTNMGKQSAQTPRGLFFTNWKGRRVTSTVDDEWILNWNFNIHNTQGVGWHQYALPGYPASHSCLRLLDADAQWLYNWADQWVLADKNTVKVKGTPVIVFGDYKFGVKGIWHRLVEDASITHISKSQLEEVIEPYLAEIYNQQLIREEYNETKSASTTPIKNDSLKVVNDSLE